MMKKKNISILLAVSLCISVIFAGCRNTGTQSGNNYTTTETTTRVTNESTVESTTEAKNETDYEITYTNVKTYTNGIGSTRVQVIVEIENTGTTDLYTSTGSCDLEDENGDLVSVMKYVSTYPNVIAPGEKGYMYEETSLDNYSGDGELTVIARPDIEKSNVHNIRYDVTDVSLSDNQYGTVDVMGRLTNTSRDIQSISYAVIIYYDDNHIPLAVNSTSILEDLHPDDQIGFEIGGMLLPDLVTSESISDYIIYAYPMQYQY